MSSEAAGMIDSMDGIPMSAKTEKVKMLAGELYRSGDMSKHWRVS